MPAPVPGIAAASGPLLVVGHATRDLDPSGPRGWRLGGSVSHVALAAARLGVPVRAVVGLDRESASAREIDLLSAAGVELHPLVFAQAPVFRNVEGPGGRHQECLAVGPQLEPSAVPKSWRTAGVWALVPVIGELGGEEWARAPGGDAFVAFGWQGLLRERLAGGPTRARPPGPDPLLGRAGLAIASVPDFAAAGAGWGAPRADRRLAPLFPHRGQLLVVTDGERGGRLLIRSPGGWDAVPYGAAPAVAEDPTGAGDVFLGAFLATFLDPTLLDPTLLDAVLPRATRFRGGPRSRDGRTAMLRRRLRFAALAAAMSIEGRGLTAIPTRAALLARLRGPGG